MVVDCRKDSKTYFKWKKFIINQNNQKIILISSQMGNPYYVSLKNSVYHYKLAYNGEYLNERKQFT